MKSTTYAYLAGFMDGEGTVGIAFTRGVHILRVSVGNTDPAPIRLLKDTFGGKVYAHQPPGQRKGGGLFRFAYQWVTQGRNAAAALRLMIPYLLVKRPQAELALAFQAVHEEHFHQFYRQRHSDESWNQREAFREQIIRLNGRYKYVRTERPQPRGDVNRSLRAVRIAQQTT